MNPINFCADMPTARALAIVSLVASFKVGANVEFITGEGNDVANIKCIIMAPTPTLAKIRATLIAYGIPLGQAPANGKTFYFTEHEPTPT